LILAILTLVGLFVVYRYVPETIQPKEREQKYASSAQSQISDGD
jgi:hypothetical protein